MRGPHRPVRSSSFFQSALRHPFLRHAILSAFRPGLALAAALLIGGCLGPGERVAGADVERGAATERGPAAVSLRTAISLAVPADFTEATVVSGLSSPTAMAFAPDGRLFVCQQGGQLRVVKNGALLSTPFLTVTTTSSGERGLLGVAFDPDFAANRYLYVYYTATSPNIHNRLSRFTASSTNPDVVQSGSETILLELDALSSATNHNGGALHFGPDGKLYVAVGDNATGSNSQTLANLLGKLLRLNKDGTIPTDNPFYGSASGKNRAIWVLGLRNPFSFDVQAGTGRIFINDVGQNAWEEVNEGVAGANYGWPAVCEGMHYNGTTIPKHASNPKMTAPKAFWVPVISPGGLIIYKGDLFSSWKGNAIIVGLSSQQIVRVTITGDTAKEAQRIPMGKRMRGIREDKDGAIWVLEDGAGGKLMKLTPN